MATHIYAMITICSYAPIKYFCRKDWTRNKRSNNFKEILFSVPTNYRTVRMVAVAFNFVKILCKDFILITSNTLACTYYI